MEIAITQIVLSVIGLYLAYLSGWIHRVEKRGAEARKDIYNQLTEDGEAIATLKANYQNIEKCLLRIEHKVDKEDSQS